MDLVSWVYLKLQNYMFTYLGGIAVLSCSRKAHSDAPGPRPLLKEMEPPPIASKSLINFSIPA